MQAFFESAEHRVYGILSSFIALVTLFFIARQAKTLILLRLPIESNRPFYIGFLILAILTIGSIAFFHSSTTAKQALIDWKKYLSALLLIWLPGVVLFVYAVNESRNFHYLFQVALGGYAILSGILISAFYIDKERQIKPLDNEAQTTKEWLRSQGLPTLLLIIFTTALFFTFGAYRLTQYAAVDEPLWLDGRIAKYWKNIGERDWKGTSISDKPGITVALATGPGLWFKGTSDFKTEHREGEIYNLKNDVEGFYLAYRLPLLIVITLLLPLFYFFLERLLGRRSALFCYVFIATSPILIGMAKIINPDSLLWIFTPLSLIAYLVFLRRRSFRYIIFSGIFLGLALLTKYVANILFVFFLGLMFLEYLYHPRVNLISFSEYLKKSLKDFALLLFAALATFYILFPAVWIKPSKLLSGTIFSQAFEKVAPLFIILVLFILIDDRFNKSRIVAALLSLLEKVKYSIAAIVSAIFLGTATFMIVNTWAGMPLYDFMDLLASPKSIASKSAFAGAYLTNFYPLFFGVTPLIFLLLLITPFFFTRKHFIESVALRTSFYFVIFILLYYFGTTINHVGAITRYQIILYPMAAIIAGIALEHLAVFAHRRLKLKDMPTPVFTASALTIFGLLSLLSTPFPLSYASTMLPGKYHIDIKDMGAGSYEVAKQLNKLPHAEDMLIWTDKDGVCKFFVGRCKRGLDYLKLRNDGLDYIVVSAGRESRTTKMMAGDILTQKPGLIHFEQYYTRTDPTFEIDINGRPSHYVKVFKFVDPTAK